MRHDGVSGLLGAALPRVKRRHLERLAVPSPKEDVLEALEGLAEAEREYLDWAREAREARAELFARSSFADTVPRLLERQRLERERVQAGRDSRSLDYLVRNYYPHPVAVRRESLLQKAHGETRAREAQECAEIAVSLVSFLALAQWRALEGPDAPDFPPHLAQYVQGNRFTFDWGKHRTFVDAVLAASRKHENPLTLPIPELATLEVGSEAPWSEAEAALWEARNQAAHLYRPSPTEAQVLSERIEENLCTLLESLAFLSSARLAVVRDYSRDALTGEREARVQVLAGASRVFPREHLEVDEELARAANGLLEELLHGRPLPEIPTGEAPEGWVVDTAPEPTPADEPAALPGGVDTEEEEAALVGINDWLGSMGLPEGQFLYEIQDPETSEPTAILDLAWPDGLQEGLSRPVTLLLDEGKETLAAANAAGYRYFQTVDDFRRYVRDEIRPGVES